jgi:CO dehydrogenase maturation factor
VEQSPYSEKSRIVEEIISIKNHLEKTIKRTTDGGTKMGYTIAVAGKGGTGKTTINRLVIDYLVKTKKGPILAVDADANSNLNEVLERESRYHFGEIAEEVNRRETAAQGFPGGMTKAQYLQYRLNTSITEGTGMTFLSGKIRRPWMLLLCERYLKEQLDKVSDQYKYLVIDNEAEWNI